MQKILTYLLISICPTELTENLMRGQIAYGRLNLHFYPAFFQSWKKLSICYQNK